MPVYKIFFLCFCLLPNLWCSYLNFLDIIPDLISCSYWTCTSMTCIILEKIHCHRLCPFSLPSLFWISFIGMLRLCNISYGPCAFSLQYSSFHLYLLQFEYSLFISLLVQQSSLGLCLILVNLLIFESSCIFIYMISLVFIYNILFFCWNFQYFD